MAQAAFSTVELEPAVAVPVGVPVISHVIVPALEKVGNVVIGRSKHAAVMAAITDATILA